MVVVAPAESRHVGALTELAEQMDRFYGATDEDLAPFAERVAQVTDALFGAQAASSVLLAWDGERLVGFATYSFLWPAVGMTRSLYLKELYVATQHRGHGVGRLLMDGLRRVAREHRCSRIEFTADIDNADARRFYERLGIRRQESKIFYRMDMTGGDS